MKLSLSLLALTAALGFANSSLAFTAPSLLQTLRADAATEAQVFRVDSDEDDEDDEGGWGWGGGDDDDDDEGCDDDDDEGDDDEGEGGCAMNGQRNPAPQGSTTPPKNGLFNGAAPKVITN